MAQTTFTPFAESDALNASTMNTLFTNIRTQSTSVNGSNIRIEGLERHALAPNAVLKYGLSASISGNDAVSYGEAGAGATYADISTTNLTVRSLAGARLRIDNGGAGFVYDATSQTCIIHASIEVRQTYINNNQSFFLVYKLSGAAAAAIPFTERTVDYIQMNGFTETTNKTSVTISHNLYTSGTYEYIEVQVIGNAGNWTIPVEFLYLSESHLDLTIWEH